MRVKRSVYLTILLLIITLSVYPDNRQEPKVTLSKKSVTWQALLQEIEKQSGYIFSFNPHLFDKMDKINIEAKEEPLTHLLDRLFKSTHIAYSIVRKHIILKEKEKTVKVSGYVTHKDGTGKLAGATILEQNSNKGMATAADGSFLFELPPGDVQLEVSYIGFQRYRQTISSLTNDTTLYINLEESTRLKDVIVMGNEKAPVQVTSPQPGAYIINKETLERIPVIMGEADVVKTIQTLPGVSSGIEGFAGMYVRGGVGDDNLFMVDGIPIYEVNHLGGLFSPFNVQLVEEVGFYKAGFPAKYGSRLSSVVDVRFRDGDPEEFHGTAMLGLTSGGLQFEGPLIKNKTTFNIGLRRSWLDVLSVPALAILNSTRDREKGKIIMRYAFQDFNFKLNHLLTPKDKLYISGYWSSDFLKGGKETQLEHDNQYSYNKDLAKLRWGNLLLMTGWNHQFSSKFASDLKVAYTGYRSTLKRDSEGEVRTTGDQQINTIKQDNHNSIRDVHIRNEYTFNTGKKHQIRFGGHYIYHHYSPETTSSYFGTALNKDYLQDDEIKGHEFTLYAEDDWTPGEKFRLLWGARFNYYKVGDKPYTSFEPRISAILNPYQGVELQISYSRMRQYIHQLAETHISLPTDMWLPSSRHFKPQVSDQFSVGAKYKEIKGYEFTVEGYYKRMQNILDIKDDAFVLPPGYRWQEKLTSGKGRSYGMDLLVQKKTGRITGWVGYGLLWTDRKFGEIEKGAWFPSKFDNRHTLNIMANYKLRKNVELTASWHYKTGNRVTLALESFNHQQNLGTWSHEYPDANDYVIYDKTFPGYVESRNNVRLPAYHRLDVGINFYRPKSRGRMGIWNVSIYNAYSRFNPIAIERREWYSYGDEGRRNTPQIQFRTVGLFPIIPSVSYTYKF